MERHVMENKVQEDELLGFSQLNPTNTAWKHDLEFKQHQIEELEEKYEDVGVDTECSIDDSKEELELLLHRVKTAATLLTYLKSKARIMAIPQSTHTSCRIKHQEGVGLVDKCCTTVCDWLNNVDLSTLEDPDAGIHLNNTPNSGSVDSNRASDGQILSSICIVADVMECLVKRIIMAEHETAYQMEKVKLGMEESIKKTLQIEIMSAKVEEMEKFALGANSTLSEMRQKVEDMVQETSRQRQQAEENKQELRHVKQSFEIFRSFVRNLISVREVLISEQHFPSVDDLFDRLLAETTHLENEKARKEAEVQKLIEENAGLRALLDKKEAQLLAMNEQCKFMTLRSPGI